MPDSYLADDDEAAHAVAHRYGADHGSEAWGILDGLLSRMEQARDKLDGDEWLRVDRVAGVTAEALSFIEDRELRWADGDNEDRKIADEPPPGWRRSDITRAFAFSDEPDPHMMHRTAPPRVPRRTGPRRRGSGRPRGVSRPSSRGGDSGDDGPGEPDADLAWAARGLASCPCCGNEAAVRPACRLCGGLGFVGRELRNRWKRGER